MQAWHDARLDDTPEASDDGLLIGRDNVDAGSKPAEQYDSRNPPPVLARLRRGGMTLVDGALRVQPRKSLHAALAAHQHAQQLGIGAEDRRGLVIEDLFIRFERTQSACRSADFCCSRLRRRVYFPHRLRL